MAQATVESKSTLTDLLNELDNLDIDSLKQVRAHVTKLLFQKEELLFATVKECVRLAGWGDRGFAEDGRPMHASWVEVHEIQGAVHTHLVTMKMMKGNVLGYAEAATKDEARLKAIMYLKGNLAGKLPSSVTHPKK